MVRRWMIAVGALAMVPMPVWAQCVLTTDYQPPAPDVHMVCAAVDEAPGLASDLLRFRARIQADSAVLSPGETSRLAREADRLEMRTNQLALMEGGLGWPPDRLEAQTRLRQAAADLRALDQDLSFSETALPGSYETLGGPWPVTPDLTLPDLYAPPGNASSPCVWSASADGWPAACP